MRFCWVTLHVNNMEESLHFYHGLLGLPVDSRRGGGDLEIAMLGDPGMPKVELLCEKGEKITDRQTGISVGFEVESLDQAVEFLKQQGIPVVSGPFSPNPHIRFLFVRDPNGIEVQLVENR